MMAFQTRLIANIDKVSWKALHAGYSKVIQVGDNWLNQLELTAARDAIGAALDALSMPRSQYLRNMRLQFTNMVGRICLSHQGKSFHG